MQRIHSWSSAHTPPATPQPQSSLRPATSAPPHWSPHINLRGHLGGSVVDAEALTPLHQRAARRLFVTPPHAPGKGEQPPPPRRSPTRKVVASPQALGRLLARDPAAILQATDIPVAQQLKLLDAALARPGALANPTAVIVMVERILALADAPLRASALMVVLEHGRPHLAPGNLRLARIGADTFETMARCELLGAVGECVDAFQRCVDEAGAGLKQALGADIETKAGPGAPNHTQGIADDDALWLDGPAQDMRRHWDEVLQRGQEQALARAAQRMVGFYALFDAGAFLAARAAPRTGRPVIVSDTQWCFAMEQVSWLREQAQRGSPKAGAVMIEPDWLAREACQGGPHLGMVAMEAARRLQALVPDEPLG